MELFFNLFKVRFTKLTDLLREDEDIYISSDDTVHVYINLETILIKLCNPNTSEYIGISKDIKIEFIANVINLAAHYRLFFNKHRIASKIFLYIPSISTKKYINSIYNKEYRMYYKFKFSEGAGNLSLYKLIMNTIPFISIILEYIQGVYLIESDKIENSLIPYIIDNNIDNNKIKNFIVTGDIYDLQYVNYGYNIIIPKGDNSFICTENNIINYLSNLYECKGSYNLSSTFIPFILSIIGSKYRNIYNIKGMGMKTTFKTIQKAIDNKMISNNIDNIHLLLNIIKPELRENIINNYYCVNLEYQYRQLTKKNIYDILSQIKDKYDNIALRKINDKYFNNYPIMIQEITGFIEKN